MAEGTSGQINTSTKIQIWVQLVWGRVEWTTDWVSKHLVPLIHTIFYTVLTAFLYWLTIPIFQVSNIA